MLVRLFALIALCILQIRAYAATLTGVQAGFHDCKDVHSNCTATSEKQVSSIVPRKLRVLASVLAPDTGAFNSNKFIPKSLATVATDRLIPPPPYLSNQLPHPPVSWPRPSFDAAPPTLVTYPVLTHVSSTAPPTIPTSSPEASFSSWPSPALVARTARRHKWSLSSTHWRWPRLRIRIPKLRAPKISWPTLRLPRLPRVRLPSFKWLALPHSFWPFNHHHHSRHRPPQPLTPTPSPPPPEPPSPEPGSRSWWFQRHPWIAAALLVYASFTLLGAAANSPALLDAARAANQPPPLAPRAPTPVTLPPGLEEEDPDPGVSARACDNWEESPQEDEEDRHACVVCMDRRRTVVLLPCRHMCICKECATVLFQTSPQRCPLCREDVEEVFRVFV
mmetsp:Transcript_19787/g.37756  ORF Transcript_19787/g.37756 Transcript_19787/m.37756 type:complete len:391 (-) Transcript_19787:132-1304(-)